MAAEAALESASTESRVFIDSCGGSGIAGEEHRIPLGGCRLDNLLEDQLAKVAVAASVLLGNGNRPLYAASSHPHTTRSVHSRKDQQILLIARCLYPGGGGVVGREEDGRRHVAVNRQELHAIALVGRLKNLWPPYVDPEFGEWVI
ncbi:hypothetical protein Esi_0480_0007 [Ectocarpus siliculosus]|uniref:Uncharacterized protein n=1 Tax=Ectocarpus siliculosus TaxID=2880 RepID=D7G2S7_ECTSI|nr:hypothetical protein Esi_0480_0007 [Ectocarpus siliculosus]|eukprot:CBJ33431.1 hypothetical protein Esi_0480_0007 [Ectocarpus siliculosus]